MTTRTRGRKRRPGYRLSRASRGMSWRKVLTSGYSPTWATCMQRGAGTGWERHGYNGAEGREPAVHWRGRRSDRGTGTERKGKGEGMLASGLGGRNEKRKKKGKGKGKREEGKRKISRAGPGGFGSDRTLRFQFIFIFIFFFKLGLNSVFCFWG